jgi:hypothetical protein
MRLVINTFGASLRKQGIVFWFGPETDNSVWKRES